MKKCLAMALALVLLLGLAIPTFAAPSAEGDKMVKVVVIDGPNDKTGTTYNIKAGETVSLKSTPSNGSFDDWAIYKTDGTLAIAGVDYRILGASDLTASEVTIEALASLIITANYNGVRTNPFISNDEDESPATGDTTVICLSAMALVALCGVVVAKKQLAK